MVPAVVGGEGFGVRVPGECFSEFVVEKAQHHLPAHFVFQEVVVHVWHGGWRVGRKKMDENGIFQGEKLRCGDGEGVNQGIAEGTSF